MFTEIIGYMLMVAFISGFILLVRIIGRRLRKGSPKTPEE